MRGMTLVEVLVALAILGVVMTAVLPAFMMQLRSNDLNQLRAGAVVAAQTTIEDLRFEDPAGMPATGSSGAQLVTVGDHRYEVVTSYCVRPEYCSDQGRHLQVEVFFEGRRLYHAETVYSQLL